MADSLIDISAGGGDGGTDTNTDGTNQENNQENNGGSPRIYEDGDERYEVPENFWDPAANEGKGGLRIGALLKANGDLRKQVSEKPKAPDAYELTVPQDLAEKIKADPESPLAKGAMEFAKKHGLSQEAFSELTALHFQQMAGEADQDAEYESQQSKALDDALGDKAKDLKAELGAFMGGLLADDFKKNPELLAEAQLLASSAQGVLLIKAIKDKLRERPLPSTRDTGADAVSVDNLKALQASKAYNDPNHPEHEATIRKVEEGYKRLYPPKS